MGVFRRRAACVGDDDGAGLAETEKRNPGLAQFLLKRDCHARFGPGGMLRSFRDGCQITGSIMMDPYFLTVDLRIDVDRIVRVIPCAKPVRVNSCPVYSAAGKP